VARVSAKSRDVRFVRLSGDWCLCLRTCDFPLGGWVHHGLVADVTFAAKRDFAGALGRWLREGHLYVNGNYRLIAGFALAELVLAVGLAVAWSWARGHGRQPSIFKVSTWYRVFRELPPTGAETFVRVFTQSGVEYFGKVISYTTDFDLASRELFLGEPLWRRLPKETGFTLLRPPWRWLILPGPAIQGIWVSYLQSPTETPKDMSAGQADPAGSE